MVDFIELLFVDPNLCLSNKNSTSEMKICYSFASISYCYSKNSPYYQNYYYSYSPILHHNSFNPWKETCYSLYENTIFCLVYSNTQTSSSHLHIFDIIDYKNHVYFDTLHLLISLLNFGIEKMKSVNAYIGNCCLDRFHLLYESNGGSCSQL